jgi:REP element-mobilizing transposase RayT
VDVPRSHRDQTPGSYFHLVSRGNNRQPIFDEVLRDYFLTRLAAVAQEFDWSVYAYALMTNHFHLVLEIGTNGISDGMQRLNLNLARASNARFGRINHCLGDRFWSTPLKSDGHLLASLRYTLWNPARAGVGKDPADSTWTSFRASVGLDWPRGVAVDRLLAHFGRTPATGRDAFRRFVWSGRERCREPWQDGQGILR